MYNNVIVTGSLGFDQIMNFPGRFRDHILPDKLHELNVSFLVDTLTTNRGGTGGNIAYTLALLGVKPKLVAAAGSDAFDYKRFLQSVGVDVSSVKLYSNERTAMGFAMTDRNDNQLWGYYQGAMRLSRQVRLGRVNREALVVIAPNDPQAMAGYVADCVRAKVAYLYDPAFQIPRFSQKELLQGATHAAVVIGNDYEIELLKQKLHLRNQKSEIRNQNQIWVTTLGAKGSLIQQGKTIVKIPAAKPMSTIDPTGAGDGYRAGLIAGLIRGLPLAVCGRMGSTAAAYTVERYGTQTHRFTMAAFRKRYQENFGERLEF